MLEFSSWIELYRWHEQKFPIFLNKNFETFRSFNGTCRELFGEPAHAGGVGDKFMMFNDDGRYTTIGWTFYFRSETDAVFAKLKGG